MKKVIQLILTVLGGFGLFFMIFILLGTAIAWFVLAILLKILYDLLAYLKGE